MFAKINDKPPPLGFIILWELLSLGISGINFLKGFINNLVNDQLKMKLKNNMRGIFKIILLWIFRLRNHLNILIVNFYKADSNMNDLQNLAKS